MTGKFLTIKEAAEYLGVTPLTLRNWDKSGKLPTTRHPMSNYRIYKSEDLEKLGGDGHGASPSADAVPFVHPGGLDVGLPR